MKRLSILLIIVLLLGLGACAKAKTLPVDLIRVAIPSYPVSLVPTRLDGDAAKLVQAQVYETLYKQTDSVFKPVLASSFPECTQGGMRCVIKITPSINFHNGTTFTVKDAVYSINHLVEAKTTEMSSSIASAVAIDDVSFAINMTYPDGELLSKLAHPMFAMIMANSDADKKLEKMPIGTGPYKFVSNDGNNSLKLTRYDNYHGTKALIKDVEFAVYKDINKALTALRDSAVNVVTKVPLQAKEKLTTLKGLTWISGDLASTVYLGIRSQSMQNSALELQDFRKALMSSAHIMYEPGAFGVANMTNLFGIGVLGNAGQTSAFLKDTPSAKFADQPINIVSPQFAQDFDVAASIGATLKKKGFTKVSIELLAQDKLLQRTTADKGFDLMLFVWKYDLADGGDFIDSFFGSDSVNRLRYRNADLDSKIQALNRTYTGDQRKIKLKEIENILISEGMILPLTKLVDHAMVAQSVQNVAIAPDGTLNIAIMTFAKK